jgi:hypothetical protein
MTRGEADAQGIKRPVLSERPRPGPVEGWSEGTAILIPCADLRASSETIRGNVIRIPMSPKHSAMTIRLFMDEPGVTSQRKVLSAFGLGVIQRANGGAIYVVSVLDSLSSGDHETLAVIRADARKSAPADHSHRRLVGTIPLDWGGRFGGFGA